ncbi:uncharacterized protein LOC132276737 [Cornus florida]|uniref:uncharacterized protein LOC132276737 n=1 Tax=Cornus florida TaxID=4283 RepID=UPI0028A0FDCF|nr:uncharacterized protein LOC132276737 [Cornus florida]
MVSGNSVNLASDKHNSNNDSNFPMMSGSTFILQFLSDKHHNFTSKPIESGLFSEILCSSESNQYKGSLRFRDRSINLSRRESTVDLTGQIHQLPCCIKHDGPSYVSHNFKPKTTGIEIEGLMEEAYFRGRELQGTTFSLPQGYSGFVLGKMSPDKKKASDIPEGNSNCWEMNAKFKSITLWNHDSLPSQDDAFLRSFHWLAVAKALHQPVTAEDLESVSADRELKK